MILTVLKCFFERLISFILYSDLAPRLKNETNTDERRQSLIGTITKSVIQLNKMRDKSRSKN